MPRHSVPGESAKPVLLASVTQKTVKRNVKPMQRSLSSTKGDKLFRKKIRVWNRQDSKASHQGISFTEISQIAPPLQPPPSVRRIQAAQALSVLDHRRASTNIENKQINSRQKPQWAPKSCTPQLKEKDRLRMLKSMQKIKFQLQELKEEYANNINTTDDETESEYFSEEIDDEDEFYLFQ